MNEKASLELSHLTKEIKEFLDKFLQENEKITVTYPLLLTTPRLETEFIRVDISVTDKRGKTWKKSHLITDLECNLPNQKELILQGLFKELIHLRKESLEESMKELTSAEKSKLKKIIEEFIFEDEDYSVSTLFAYNKITTPVKEEISFVVEFYKRDEEGVKYGQKVLIRPGEINEGLNGFIKVGTGLKTLRDSVLDSKNNERDEMPF